MMASNNIPLFFNPLNTPFSLFKNAKAEIVKIVAAVMQVQTGINIFLSNMNPGATPGSARLEEQR